MAENNSKVGYQFTPMPKQLMHLLDINLRSMLFALVDASEYFADNNGWFYRSNDQLQMDSCLSKNLVNVTIDTLFNRSLVDVSCVGIGKCKKPNNYRVNMEMFKLFEQLNMNTDINRPENQIKTLDYKGSGYHASYLEDDPERFVPLLVKGKIIWKSTKATLESTSGDTNDSTKELTTNVTKSEHNIDNIEYTDNIYNLSNKENINNINNKKYINIDSNNNILEEKLEKDKDKEELEREMEEGVSESMTKNEEETQEYPNDTSNNNIPTVRDSNDGIGDSERKSKDEIEAEETPCEYQSLIQTEANQDSAHDDFQNESGNKSSSSSSQSNDDNTKQQEADTSPNSESHLEEKANGIKMVGLFDPAPSLDNQKKPMLSVRAATRLWAEELEAKYQTRERTLQNLAMVDPMGFEKYVNYLRLQRRKAFQQHLELIHDLASFWDIDLDLDLD